MARGCGEEIADVGFAEARPRELVGTSKYPDPGVPGPVLRSAEGQYSAPELDMMELTLDNLLVQ